MTKSKFLSDCQFTMPMYMNLHKAMYMNLNNYLTVDRTNNFPTISQLD